MKTLHRAVSLGLAAILIPPIFVAPSPAGAAGGGQNGVRSPAPKEPAAAARIHMIGHAHIDPVWRWTRDEGFAEVLATFRSALARMEEFPDFRMTASSARFYKWVAETDPALFDLLKRRVAEGRWEIAGGWWVEPDVNIPHGESLVRQGLYGQAFFETAFGRRAEIGFNPDTFGHPSTLPQILRGQGLRAYVFMRPGPHEKPDLPGPIFSWRGPDGTSIPAVQITGSYNGDEAGIEAQIDGALNRYAEAGLGIRPVIAFYGVGDHGGGPTIATIGKLEALRASRFPGLEFSRLDRYVDALADYWPAAPVVADELQHHARGCYSSVAAVKLANWRAERALLSAEKIAALGAGHLGAAYPAAELTRAWERTLFNQFHDILAGSAIEDAYIDAARDYDAALAEARDVSIRGLLRLARRVDTSGIPASEAPFIVFNPHAWAFAEPLEIEMERRDAGRVALRRADGTRVPCQELATAGVKVGSRTRIVFRDDIPPLGYRLYRLAFGTPPAEPVAGAVRASAGLLENDVVRVSWDLDTGGIRSYFWKKTGRELLAGPAAMPVVLEDTGDTWGHTIKAYDREAGRFVKARFLVLENGPERGRLRVTTSWGASVVSQDFLLDRGRPEIRVKFSVDWREAYKVLKISVPTALKTGRLAYSTPYGFIERPMTGDEEPGQTWIDLSGGDASGRFGVALLTEGKFGYDAREGDIRVTVLHSPAWSHHDPETVSEKDGFRLIDQGVHEFAYLILPHEGDWRDGGVARRAEEFGAPALAILTDGHPGDFPAERSFAELEGRGTSLPVLKLAEAGDALVARLVELDGRPARGRLRLPGSDAGLEYELRPLEIRTYRLPLAGDRRPRAVSLLED